MYWYRETTKRNASPRSWSMFHMATSMSLVQFGYEISRGAVFALFTSERLGFTDSAALPFAMACVSPFSIITLSWYSQQLRCKGPRKTIRDISLVFAMVLLISFFVLSKVEECAMQRKETRRWFFIKPRLAELDQSRICVHLSSTDLKTISKALIWMLFLFQHNYSQVLSAQQWSLIGSLLDSSQRTASTGFAIISGIITLTSALGAACVSFLVGFRGLPGLLAATASSLLLSSYFSDRAYLNYDKAKTCGSVRRNSKKLDSVAQVEDKGVIRKALTLFQRVPILKALFCEVFSCQSLSTLLQFCFVSKLSDSYPDDSIRASVGAKFYAAVCAVCGCLQFSVVPVVMKRVEARVVWKVMPIVQVCSTALLCLAKDPSLALIGTIFFMMKTVEYSVRGVVSEMAYVPLDFESRHVGKEVINVFGYMSGKSAITLFLSGLSMIWGRLPYQTLFLLTNAAALAWLACAFQLSRLVPPRAAAEVDRKDREKSVPPLVDQSDK